MDPILVLLLIAAALLVAYFFIKGAQDLDKLAAKAQAAARAGRNAEEEKILRQIVRLEPGLAAKQFPQPRKDANQRIFAQTFLRLGELCARSKSAEAFAHYRKARQLGATLTTAAWEVLAGGYADKKSTSENALGAYLAYIREHSPDGAGAKVYGALEVACLVDESKKSAERKQAVELNKKVLEANGALESPYYYMAVAYLLDGNLSAAITNLTQAQKLNPARAMTYYWMGACYLQKAGGAELDSAIPALEKFLSFPQETPQVVKRQGKAAFELGKRLLDKGAAPDQAIRYLEIAVARDDGAASYHFLLGTAYSKRQDSARAIVAFRRAATLAPDQKENQYYLGQEYFKAGSLEESREALRQAVAADPKYGEARELLAQVCLQTGRYEEVEIHCKAVVEAMLTVASGGGDYPVERSQRVEGWLWQALYRQSKFQEPIDNWERVYTGKTRYDRGPEAMFWLARCYLARGEYAEALETLDGQPVSPRGIYYSGCALAGLGRFDEAHPRFQESIEAGGEFTVPALLQRGHIFLRAGNIGAAGESYDAALGKEPLNANALYAMGNLAFRMGELDIASENFAKIPGDPRARFALGAVCEARGQIAEAIGHYEAAAPKLPRQDVRIRLGVLYGRDGRHQDAARVLEPLYNAGVESDAVLFYLGRAWVFLNQLSPAEAVWSKLAQRHPEDEEAARELARVHYLLGTQRARQGDYAAAIGQWEKYLERFPSEETVSQDIVELYLRQALLRLGSPEAEALLRRAGQDPRCDYYRALHFLKLDRFEECAAQLRAILQQSGEDSRAAYHLGLCLLRKGDSDEGLRLLQNVAGQEKSNCYGRYAAWAIANDHIQKERYSEADAALAGTM